MDIKLARGLVRQEQRTDHARYSESFVEISKVIGNLVNKKMRHGRRLTEEDCRSIRRLLVSYGAGRKVTAKIFLESKRSEFICLLWQVIASPSSEEGDHGLAYAFTSLMLRIQRRRIVMRNMVVPIYLTRHAAMRNLVRDSDEDMFSDMSEAMLLALPYTLCIGDQTIRSIALPVGRGIILGILRSMPYRSKFDCSLSVYDQRPPLHYKERNPWSPDGARINVIEGHTYIGHNQMLPAIESVHTKLKEFVSRNQKSLQDLLILSHVDTFTEEPLPDTFKPVIRELSELMDSGDYQYAIRLPIERNEFIRLAAQYVHGAETELAILERMGNRWSAIHDRLVEGGRMTSGERWMVIRELARGSMRSVA